MVKKIKKMMCLHVEYCQVYGQHKAIAFLSISITLTVTESNLLQLSFPVSAQSGSPQLLVSFTLKSEGNYLKQNLRNSSELKRCMKKAKPSSHLALKDIFS